MLGEIRHLCPFSLKLFLVRTHPSPLRWEPQPDPLDNQASLRSHQQKLEILLSALLPSCVPRFFRVLARLAASQERQEKPGKELERRRELSVAEILCVTAPKFIERYGQQAAPQVHSTLAKLSLCRTAALGGRRYRCDGCEHECVLYNSCGDRHCPQCSGAKRADWIDSTKKLLLDGINYFQVVFTLPSELSSLALGNRKKIFYSAMTLCEQTDLVLCAPKRHANRLLPHFGLVLREIPLELVPGAYVLLWHNHFEADQGHRWLRELIFEHLKV